MIALPIILAFLIGFAAVLINLFFGGFMQPALFFFVEMMLAFFIGILLVYSRMLTVISASIIFGVVAGIFNLVAKSLNFLGEQPALLGMYADWQIAGVWFILNAGMFFLGFYAAIEILKFR